MTQPHILRTAIDRLFKPLARCLHKNHMRALGIGNTQKLAYAYNRLKFHTKDAYRRKQYRENFRELIKENGAPQTPLVQMRDGWALDTSQSLPYLQEVLRDSEKIIAERGGFRRSSIGAYRSFFQDVWTLADAEKYPSFLNFATSSEVLSTVGHYLKCIPALSTTLPSGVRLVESSIEYDETPRVAKDSQLFHIDYYSLPNVYVLVLLRDVTIDNGPWTFLPKSVSQRIAAPLNNWKRAVPYRFSDDQVYSLADKNEVIEFTGRRGDVLFIESSGCFHFGSRNCITPRYQLMLGYTGACRTDFTEVFMPCKTYFIRECDSKLRKMVLDKDFIE